MGDTKWFAVITVAIIAVVAALTFVSMQPAAIPAPDTPNTAPAADLDPEPVRTDGEGVSSVASSFPHVSITAHARGMNKERYEVLPDAQVTVAFSPMGSPGDTFVLSIPDYGVRLSASPGETVEASFRVRGPAEHAIRVDAGSSSLSSTLVVTQ